ncbi:hypothetical protein Tco_0822547 [Tanacetum coccineum]|uniref:Uncharacterized protein n=1 Tax=Tanacetum coccineum TaxID=301880 RepID=A0ABQ5AJN3_9ASTR
MFNHLKSKLIAQFLWPKILNADTNYVELVDAKANVHMVKMERDFEDSAWSFNGNQWVTFILTVKDLDPKIIHFDQIDIKTFLVNFYAKDGDEIDYGFTKDHEMKCVIVGCNDPQMYRPIPHKLMLNSKVNRDGKRVPIVFNGIVLEMQVSYYVCSKKTLVGVAFTGIEWERLCEAVMFSATKAIIISSDESRDLFAGKVINGFVLDPETKFDSAIGEFSNGGAYSEKTFISEFCLCTDTKGYMILNL